MGNAYRQNIKNQYGKPDVTARDVIAVGVTVTDNSSAALTDAQGLAAHAAPRSARLEGAVVVSSSGLTAGTIGLALTVNGATVASGDLSTAGAAYLDLLLDKEALEQVSLDAGDSVRLIYAAAGLLGEAPTLSGRIHESLLE